MRQAGRPSSAASKPRTRSGSAFSTLPTGTAFAPGARPSSRRRLDEDAYRQIRKNRADLRFRADVTKPILRYSDGCPVPMASIPPRRRDMRRASARQGRAATAHSALQERCQLRRPRRVQACRPILAKASPTGSQISGRPVWARTNSAMLKCGSSSSSRRAEAFASSVRPRRDKAAVRRTTGKLNRGLD
jgi:hypothetical protein